MFHFYNTPGICLSPVLILFLGLFYSILVWIILMILHVLIFKLSIFKLLPSFLSIFISGLIYENKKKYVLYILILELIISLFLKLELFPLFVLAIILVYKFDNIKINLFNKNLIKRVIYIFVFVYPAILSFYLFENFSSILEIFVYSLLSLVLIFMITETIVIFVNNIDTLREKVIKYNNKNKEIKIDENLAEKYNVKVPTEEEILKQFKNFKKK
ncbi:hypothetical protein ACPB8Q_03305 [Methanocaldococcus indicus]|uniref:hypothetical protein n=1 Tax=Methanocaldococcus indicus TaxID=213231 RepID=UPI003C6D4A6D